MSCAHYLVDRIDVQNRSVLVTGCGPVGLLCIGIAKAYEAKSIIAVDIKESSLVLAKTMGRVDHVIKSHEFDMTLDNVGIIGADVVINASTQDVTTEDGFRVILASRRRNGRCCVQLKNPF